MTAPANSHHESPACTVLYVEDDDAAAYLFQKALAEENVRLRLFRVTNGQDGLAFSRREGTYVEVPTPDLIVLNINLPKNGFEVLEEAQQVETLRRVPKVMFSSSTSAADRQRAQTLIGTDIREILLQQKDFDAALSEHY